MTIETAKTAIDKVFDHVPNDMSGVEIGFIGGEPLLEFQLLKDIVAYTSSIERKEQYIFYATTNGTLLTDEHKAWFSAHKNYFTLGLSLDGAKETHDYNRTNSFDDIDIEFFLRTWPNQGVKMTLSEYSLPRLAENIKYIHSLGFKEIGGVNLFEGNFDWSRDEYLHLLIPQLADLVAFYVDNDALALNQMFDKRLSYCEVKNRGDKKWCGIGTGAVFFDTDGKVFPCPFVTPMTFSQNDLSLILQTDFTDESNFIDKDCYKNCYIYPICPTCSGANYFRNNKFTERDKTKCRIQKLISLFIADLQAKRIKKNPQRYDNATLYHTIEAIRRVRALFLPEFAEFFRD